LEFAFDTDWAGYKEIWSCSYGSDADLIANMLSGGYNNRVDEKGVQMDELINNDKEKGFKQMISGKDPPVNSLDEMKQHYPESIKTAQNSYDYRQFIKRVPVVNFQSTIIEEKLNGKETHDEGDERFEYAWLRIRLEHAPRIDSK
jgi:hypothetical protein